MVMGDSCFLASFGFQRSQIRAGGAFYGLADGVDDDVYNNILITFDLRRMILIVSFVPTTIPCRISRIPLLVQRYDCRLSMAKSTNTLSGDLEL